MCYPADSDGCRRKSDGSYECVGTCAPGTQKCQDGKLTECTGFVKPVKEICGADPAQDDDCNGQVDDECPCPGPNFLRLCFPGPGNWLFGICRRGMQECVDGKLGACLGAVVARDETCDNMGADDDCNGLDDDVPGTGGFHLNCDPRAQGICRTGWDECVDGQIKCVPRAPLSRETVCDGVDDTCNGSADEEVGLDTDENNCGRCGNVCGGNQLCCAGECEDLGSNDHCSSCSPCGVGKSCCNGQCINSNGNDTCNGCCRSGQTCCGTSCITLGSNNNCASCGDACDSDEACCGGHCAASGGDDNCSGVCDSCGGSVCCGGACQEGNCSVCCGSMQTCCGSECMDLAEGAACPE